MTGNGSTRIIKTPYTLFLNDCIGSGLRMDQAQFVVIYNSKNLVHAFTFSITAYIQHQSID